MNLYELPSLAPSVAPAAVREQLRCILASELFVRAQRMQRFLEFVVEETLAGRENQIGEYGIGTAVFDRPADFDPAADPIVRNEARRLRFKLAEYYAPSGAEHKILISLPKGGYVPTFRPLTAARTQPREVAGPIRVAVLPFEAAPESAMPARALCMSLTANLTHVDGLEAVAHGFLPALPLRDAVAELGLSHMIHGSLWHEDGRCRMIVNLIEAVSGTQLWAREYDFSRGEMMKVQPEIARTVLREVTAHLDLLPLHSAQIALAA